MNTSANSGTAFASDVDMATSQNIQIVIDTPKGSRNKYAFDPKLRLFKLSRLLPKGMSFPLDYDSRCYGEADQRAWSLLRKAEADLKAA